MSMILTETYLKGQHAVPKGLQYVLKGLLYVSKAHENVIQNALYL